MHKTGLDTETVIKALSENSFKNWDKEVQKEALKLRGGEYQDYKHILELIVDNGLVNKLPDDILNQDSILIKEDNIEEVESGLIHMCTSSDQWKDLPKHLITKENLRVKDNRMGNTPVHEAATSGCFEFIVENLNILTEKDFRSINKDGETTLEIILCGSGRWAEKNNDQSRPLPHNIKEMLTAILKKFKPESLKNYYHNTIKKNTRIENSVKKAIAHQVIMPILNEKFQNTNSIDI